MLIYIYIDIEQKISDMEEIFIFYINACSIKISFIIIKYQNISFLFFLIFYERSINVHTYLYIKSYLHLCYN
ncbi:hypothetical protein PFFVO_01625 [Plasmodium falciparum Vietnam Oak-Knoll (FVO)]|uniref:Uncharacterized protein n=1 Tax=Plasmodium falciparum Vietnam Oak-Knoll (FVO) TaxID=1036723 RepID=A0A024VA48_PLAFA|nr:hypothetical protein PFFVO_01625 [Plasmodium falciparum Vietnam Oak-Knoll (FVO)]